MALSFHFDCHRFDGAIERIVAFRIIRSYGCGFIPANVCGFVRREHKWRGIADLSFGDFFPEHKEKTLYGMLAAIEVNEDIEKRVLRQGIYLVKVEGDLCRLSKPERPRVFN